MKNISRKGNKIFPIERDPVHGGECERQFSERHWKGNGIFIQQFIKWRFSVKNEWVKEWNFDKKKNPRWLRERCFGVIE